MLESWGLCREAIYFGVSGKIDSAAETMVLRGLHIRRKSFEKSV